jgi:hypothetical protein
MHSRSSHHRWRTRPRKKAATNAAAGAKVKTKYQ